MSESLSDETKLQLDRLEALLSACDEAGIIAEIRHYIEGAPDLRGYLKRIMLEHDGPDSDADFAGKVIEVVVNDLRANGKMRSAMLKLLRDESRN